MYFKILKIRINLLFNQSSKPQITQQSTVRKVHTCQPKLATLGEILLLKMDACMALRLFSLRNKVTTFHISQCVNTKSNFVCYLPHRNQFKIHFRPPDGGYNSRHRNITLVENDETDSIITQKFILRVLFSSRKLFC